MTAPNGPRLDRLSIGDLSALWADRPNGPMHVALAGSFDTPSWFDERGRLRLDWLREQVDARTWRAPVFRRRLYRTRFGEGLPLWVEDDELDIRRHVHATDACRGMHFARFVEWAGRSALEPLDPDRPLWRLTFAPGLADGSVGVLVTMHHVAVDGLAGVAALSSLLDGGPAAGGPEGEPLGLPATSPPPRPTHRLLLVDNARFRAEALLALTAHRSRPRTARQSSSPPRPSMWSMLKRRAPRTPLTGRLSAGRRAAVLTVPLDAAVGSAHSAAATVNDLVLAAMTAGLREWLRAVGHATDGVTMRCSVPVSAPGRGQNQGRVVIAPLPVGEPDPAIRLATIAAAMRRLKSTGADVSHTEITSHPLFPVWLARASIGVLAARGSHWVNCYVTNVRGPAEPLWLAGAPLSRAVGIAPLVAGVRLGVTVFSYAGVLDVTLLGDGEVPAWSTLVAGTARELDALTRSGRRSVRPVHLNGCDIRIRPEERPTGSRERL
jgi:WS/DGAT/MGAT family acyltransferase